MITRIYSIGLLIIIRNNQIYLLSLLGPRYIVVSRRKTSRYLIY